MNFLRREIFSSILKTPCFCKGICFIRPLSHCSVKRNTFTSDLHESKASPRFAPVGGSPVAGQSIGQPTHKTHPHRISEGEILPGIKLEEFQVRRQKLLEAIEIFASKNEISERAHVIIIPSSSKKFMTEAIPYIFRQNSDFLYLTGCLEPDCILTLISQDKGKKEVTLFLRGRDPLSELWDGPRTGIDEAVDFFGVDKCLPLTVFESYLKSFTKELSKYVLWYDYRNDIHSNIQRYMRDFIIQSSNKNLESPRPLIHRLRLYKSLAEQELMKKSCEIGARALTTTIKNSKPWDNEAQIFARIDYESRMNGAEYLAYPPVVAGGNRANIIHYINNDQIIADGELVLMDAGCEYHGYSSDITRTWPISGKFSPIQKILYEAVHSVQEELIKICAQLPSLDTLYAQMCKLLGARLKEAGVISRNYNEKELSEIARLLCPHHASHYLGMDVHDTSSIPRTIALEPGMVFTIEPGVYINFNNKIAFPEFRGFGVRIEDDILMTENGPLVLTSSCPKHPDEIEKLFIDQREID